MTPTFPAPIQPLRAVIRPMPLGQVAYDRIRRGLMAGGELDGVDRLIEQDLAARLAMSRTPIRDALHRLALMGFLQQASGRGYVRRSFSVRDAREHYDLKVLLEPVAAELAARGDKADRQAGARRLRADAASAGEPAATRFHLAVAELSGNLVLARVISNVTERLAGFGIPEAYAGAEAEISTAHMRIASLIERGDVGAGRAMTAHLEARETALIERLSTTAEVDAP